MTETESNPIGPVNQHVRFGVLPVVDHMTGIVHHPQLREPANGAIAQRRVENADARRTDYAEEWHRYWIQTHPQEAETEFEDIAWIKEPHPGTKVVLPSEKKHEQVSPKTCPPSDRAPFKSTNVTATKDSQIKAEGEEPRKYVGKRKPGKVLTQKQSERLDPHKRPHTRCVVQ